MKRPSGQGRGLNASSHNSYRRRPSRVNYRRNYKKRIDCTLHIIVVGTLAGITWVTDPMGPGHPDDPPNAGERNKYQNIVVQKSKKRSSR